MAPQTRRMSFPTVLIERDSDSEESSSEDEDEDGEVQNEDVEESEEERVEEKDEASKATTSRREPITISLKKVCKVKPFN